MTSELSAEDAAFLSACELEFKYRYTENDEEFMKVFNAEPSSPPIVENWKFYNNRGGHRFDRKKRASHPYKRDMYNRNRGYQGQRDQDSYNRGYSRGYNDYEQGDNYNNTDRFQNRRRY